MGRCVCAVRLSHAIIVCVIIQHSTMLLGLVYYDNKQNLVFLEYARSPQGFVFIINHNPHGVEKLDFLLI